MPSTGWTSSQRPASIDVSSLRTGLASSRTVTRMRLFPRGSSVAMIEGGRLSTSNDALAFEPVRAKAGGLPGASDATTRSR